MNEPFLVNSKLRLTCWSRCWRLEKTTNNVYLPLTR